MEYPEWCGEGRKPISECTECGQEFKEGEIFYIRKTYKNHVVGYLCEGCYESKYIEV